ncbi:SRPBCC family protein [Chitinophaga sp. GbtcB8]|uniref:SRPBCC family protein n=1 Tax=Chitinophaga sp. GbtcB8 TaxID=2824753 RepID=UPI001C2FAB1C|nr:SRPBCC family protein [Chitinophaga sp. GbtcB8]
MNILLTIVLIIVALVALLLIVALFSKKSYTVAREITIRQPKQTVFNYIRFIKNQDNYNKWSMADPDAIKTYTGTDGNAGFIYAWDSKVKNVGKGEQEIKGITEGDRIDLELRFVRPFEGVAFGNISTTALAEDQTKVKWSFSSSMKYPMNIMLLLMNLEGMLGKDLEISLMNLKTVLER